MLPGLPGLPRLPGLPALPALPGLSGVPLLSAILSADVKIVAEEGRSILAVVAEVVAAATGRIGELGLTTPDRGGEVGFRGWVQTFAGLALVGVLELLS